MSLWQRYQQHVCTCPDLGIELDISRMDFADGFLESMGEPMDQAYRAMDALEAGAIANPDENRQVGHYWLRAPDRAPDEATRRQIVDTLEKLKTFAADVHAGKIKPAAAERFTDVLVIGIGGSALGPQFVAEALGDPAADRMGVWFFDNTDPDGMDRVLAAVGDKLSETLCVVISKSGRTPEELLAYCGLSAQDIVKQAMSLLELTAA